MNFLPEAPGLSLTWRATGHTGSAAHGRVVGALQAVVVNGLKSFQALSWGQEWPGHPLILCSAFLLQVIGCLGPVRRTLKSPSTVSSGNSQLWPATSCLVEEDDGLSKVGGSLRKVAA